MLNIVAVQVADYAGRGAEYVEKLFAGVRRHMPDGIPYRAICFTDDAATVPDGVETRELPPGITGWWNKLALFQPGALPDGERVLFLDLDTVVCGGLGDLSAYDGRFAIMRDVFYPEHMQSSVMAWEAGTVGHIWTTWDRGGRPQFDPRGDQRWIEAMQPKADYWQDVVPGQIVSFKADCLSLNAVPDNARLLIFHGRPRPHECEADFVRAFWNQSRS